MKIGNFLILTGMSILTLLGCSTKTDYDALSTWEFINNSSYSLQVDGGENSLLNFTLPKGGRHSFDISFGTDKDVSENDFYSPYDIGSTMITLDGERIITTSKITDRENYTVRILGERHYQFTYTFTDADFPAE